MRKESLVKDPQRLAHRLVTPQLMGRAVRLHEGLMRMIHVGREGRRLDSRFVRVLGTTVVIFFTGAPAAAQDGEQAVLASLARVRIQVYSDSVDTRVFGTKWHTGRVIGGVTHCIAVTPDSLSVRDFRPAIPAGTPVPPLAVPLTHIRRIQVSSIYDGQFTHGPATRMYEPGADISQEEWIELSMDSIMADPTTCPPH